MLISSFHAADAGAALRDRVTMLSRELVTGLRSDAYGDDRTLPVLSTAHRTLRSSEAVETRARADLARLDAIQLVLAREAAAGRDAAASAAIDGAAPAFEGLAGSLIGGLEAWHGSGPLVGSLPPGGLIPSMQDLITGLDAQIGGIADPAAALDAARAWLAPGGTAEALGLIALPAPSVLSGSEPGVLALADPDLRDQIALLAFGASAVRSGNGDRIEAATGALLVSASLAETAGSIGAFEEGAEAALGAATSRADAARLEIARGTGVDPATTAAALRDNETQLETLYTLTGRLARLTLASRL
ncbi:MAG: hypothetical protein ACU0BS_10430 [Hasllibacter sp.]